MQWNDRGCTSAEAWGIRQLKANVSAKGLSRDPNVIHTGKNSGYAAINLAYHLGAERILLLGYDMQMKGVDRHWFGAHPEGLEVASNYAEFIRCFETIKPSVYNLEIWNLSRETALHCFEVHNFDETYKALKRLGLDRQAEPSRGMTSNAWASGATPG